MPNISRKRNILLLLFTLVIGQWTHSAILIEDNGKKIQTRATQATTWNSVYNFKKTHRVAVGTGISGVHGLLGVHLDLAYTPSISGFIGYGQSFELSTFTFGMKRYYDGKSVSPYLGILGTNWFGRVKDSKKPKIVPEWFKKRAEITETSPYYNHFFIVPTVGVKYYQKTGTTVGMALFAEIDFFIDTALMKLYPTGMLGAEFLF